jgi:hypothetical protein
MIEAYNEPSQNMTPLKAVHLGTFGYIFWVEASTVVAAAHGQSPSVPKVVCGTLGTIGLLGVSTWLERVAHENIISRETPVELDGLQVKRV